MQILQGAARLGNDGFSIAPHDRQRGADGGDASYKVSSPVVEFSAVQGGFGGLEFLFDGGMSAAKRAPWHTSPTTRAGHSGRSLAATPATDVPWHLRLGIAAAPRSFDETLGTLDVVGGRGMEKGFNLQAVVFVPLAGSAV